LNRTKIDKPSTLIKPGDVLTIVVGPAVRTIEIVAIGLRRGPAAEARLLFNDLALGASPPNSQGETPGQRQRAAQTARAERRERPTKRERRQIDKLKARSQL
jgi:ribosome-associated heat shock protein Hsp15